MVAQAPADAAGFRDSLCSHNFQPQSAAVQQSHHARPGLCKQHCTDIKKDHMSHLAYWMSVKARVMRAVIEVMLLALNGAARSSPSARTRPSTGCTMQAVPQPNISLKRPSAAAWRKPNPQFSKETKVIYHFAPGSAPSVFCETLES